MQTVRALATPLPILRRACFLGPSILLMLIGHLKYPLLSFDYLHQHSENEIVY